MELLLVLIQSSFSKIYLCLGIKASSMHEISVLGGGGEGLAFPEPLQFLSFSTDSVLCPEDLFVVIYYSRLRET